jgi:hypothetical protein
MSVHCLFATGDIPGGVPKIASAGWKSVELCGLSSRAKVIECSR